MRFLENNNGRGIIADDMGLGKTLQSVFWILRNPESKPVIIACPSSIKYQWQEELEKEDIKSDVLEGETPYEPEHSVWIFNYRILQHWKEKLIELKPETIIMDECHYTRSRDSKRTKACRFISRYCDNVIGLSGTPIVNKPVEYFPILNMVAPDEFESYMRYAMNYCDLKANEYGGGFDDSGADNLDELFERTKPYRIRRLKENVWDELPEKTYTTIPVKIDNREEYNKTINETLGWMGEHSEKEIRQNALVLAGKLTRKAGEGKVSTAVEWISDWLENNDDKLVVYAVHRKVVDGLYKEFKDEAVYIDGRVKVGKEREKAKKEFINDDSCRVCIATIETSGTGMDGLQKVADTAAFVEFEWTPKVHDQAEDRLIRFGQDSSRCFFYYFVGVNTRDERNIEILKRKEDIVSDVVDGGKPSQGSMADVLLSDLRRELNG